jgi:phospholipid transport system substrate-binding protein
VRKFLGALLAAGAAAALLALPAQAAVQAADPTQLVQMVTAEARGIAKTRTGADREAAVRQLLQTRFDLSYMGSKALGTHWALASEQQRARFLAAVETSEARAYGERLDTLTGSSVTVRSVVGKPSGAWIVDSSLTSANGQPIKLEWEVRDSSQGLRVADLKVSGVSVFMTRRVEFNSYIQSHGGAVEPLVKALETRAAAR